MKRFLCSVMLLCLFMGGCGQKHAELRTFSYTEHCVEYSDQKISILETQGQKKQPVRNADDAIAIAKKHCLINNVDIMVEYDPLTGVYCVIFMPVFEMDGNTLYYTDSSMVYVYVNEDGITLMTRVTG